MKSPIYPALSFEQENYKQLIQQLSTTPPLGLDDLLKDAAVRCRVGTIISSANLQRGGASAKKD